MNVKNLALGIGIIILTIFVFVYAINTFYPKPGYSEREIYQRNVFIISISFAIFLITLGTILFSLETVGAGLIGGGIGIILWGTGGY